MNAKSEMCVSRVFAPVHMVCVNDAVDDQGNRFTIVKIAPKGAVGTQVTLSISAAMECEVVTDGSPITLRQDTKKAFT